MLSAWGSFEAYAWHASRRVGAVSSTKDLRAAQALELKNRITQKIGNQDHLGSREEQQAGQRVVESGMEWWSWEDADE